MNNLKILFLGCILFVGVSCQEKIKVSIYYEALCGDSKTFIVNQLYPTYQKLNSIMDLDFVPYGKAIQNKVDGKWKFECQHGPPECFGNKVQACALHQNYNESTELSYVKCLMKKRYPDKAGEVCAKKVGISWEKINECVTSDVGDEYLAEYGDRTHGINPQISFIPTILLNDEYDQKIQWDILANLTGVVCEKMVSPDVCK